MKNLIIIMLVLSGICLKAQERTIEVIVSDTLQVPYSSFIYRVTITPAYEMYGEMDLENAGNYEEMMSKMNEDTEKRKEDVRKIARKHGLAEMENEGEISVMTSAPEPAGMLFFKARRGKEFNEFIESLKSVKGVTGLMDRPDEDYPQDAEDRLILKCLKKGKEKAARIAGAQGGSPDDLIILRRAEHPGLPGEFQFHGYF